MVAVGEEQRLDRFGLIHDDQRPANLLINSAGAITVIDFDDRGFGWCAVNFAAAIGFFEDDPLVPASHEAWLHGNRDEFALSPAQWRV